ncbi:MAG TPA: metallophosphoesterase [Spirochaetota bacterium]|nr:metallophosphoesterase [Spirochaetota bacterium]HNT11579.1 metallophosphoesterase [Spirochaetota bacterium]HNV49174.1 metallophosphoesterase [Spirochaetota bacterium]HOS39266.1 metallophosphoesterase [Spirochaetota bacterium]HPI23587.1 metallophosphoesterase [Spirochaetota bacterium]
MKIVYLTDIHGAFERVKNLLVETVADVYIIAGDLIDIPFYNMDSAIKYHELQTYFHALRRRMEQEGTIIEDFIDELLDMPNVSDEIQEMGSKYQQYTIRARRVMQQKYKIIENIVSTKQSALCLCLPGNYDMDLKYTSLHERDLHLHWYQVEHLKIAGYGGADTWTAGIPERYVVNHQAGIGVDDKKNEMNRFFKAVKPDIIVSHQPAHGVHDRLSFKGPSGSPALRTYCENNPVLLCLTGHIHSDWGFFESDGTVYLNPSNFGEVTTVTGEVSEGGFFHRIEVDAGRVVGVKFRKLVDDRVYDIADYVPENGKWTERVVDAERFEALRRGENFDMKVKKYSHIPEIVLFKEIKQFFRMFQTQESEERVERLEEVVQRIEGKLDDIAMDLVGSVNLGMSQPSSDIDVVLYLRCNAQCSEMLVNCEHFKQAERLIREQLGDDYKFEIIDCIDLTVVERSIREKNYECEVTQRFVTYRSICRPVNYRVIAPLEDLLNDDIEFRMELEGSIRSYFKIFVTTSQHIRSFDKYESRLKSIGIKLPEAIRRKIIHYLQGGPPTA